MVTCSKLLFLYVLERRVCPFDWGIHVNYLHKRLVVGKISKAGDTETGGGT